MLGSSLCLAHVPARSAQTLFALDIVRALMRTARALELPALVHLALQPLRRSSGAIATTVRALEVLGHAIDVARRRAGLAAAVSGAFVEDNLQFWRGTAAVAAAANDGKIRAHTVALLCSVLLGSLLLARTVGGTTALHNTAFELGAPEYARVRPSARCTPLHPIALWRARCSRHAPPSLSHALPAQITPPAGRLRRRATAQQATIGVLEIVRSLARCVQRTARAWRRGAPVGAATAALVVNVTEGGAAQHAIGQGGAGRDSQWDAAVTHTAEVTPS